MFGKTWKFYFYETADKKIIQDENNSYNIEGDCKLFQQNKRGKSNISRWKIIFVKESRFAPHLLNQKCRIFIANLTRSWTRISVYNFNSDEDISACTLFCVKCDEIK